MKRHILALSWTIWNHYAVNVAIAPSVHARDTWCGSAHPVTLDCQGSAADDDASGPRDLSVEAGLKEMSFNSCKRHSSAIFALLNIRRLRNEHTYHGVCQ